MSRILKKFHNNPVLKNQIVIKNFIVKMIFSNCTFVKAFNLAGHGMTLN